MSTKTPGTQTDLAALIGAQAAADTEDVVVRGITVTVRGLTRGEAGPIEGLAHDPLELERRLLSAAVVAVNGKPQRLTTAQVKTWQDNSPAAEMNPVSAAVLKLSGMAAGQMKEDVARFPGAAD